MWRKMKYFKESEFSNFKMMDSKLLNMLDELREEYGYPIKITSDYRSPDHPIEAAKKEGFNMEKLRVAWENASNEKWEE